MSDDNNDQDCAIEVTNEKSKDTNMFVEYVKK